MTPKESKGSLGLADNGNDMFGSQMRTLTIDVRDKTGIKVRKKHVLAACLVRHSGWQHFRFQRGDDGKTVYTRSFGRE